MNRHLVQREGWESKMTMEIIRHLLEWKCTPWLQHRPFVLQILSRNGQRDTRRFLSIYSMMKRGSKSWEWDIEVTLELSLKEVQYKDNPPSAFANSSTEIGSSLGGSKFTGTLGSNLPDMMIVDWQWDSRAIRYIVYRYLYLMRNGWMRCMVMR